MDVLVCLAAEPGAVISKEELLASAWAGAFVEEGVLAQAVHSLRKALGDDARKPRFIQTIPKRGYRLLARVDPQTTAPVAVAPAEESNLDSAGRFPLIQGAWLLHQPWLLLSGAALLMVAVVLGLMHGHRHSKDRREPATSMRPNRIVVLPFENLGKPEDAYFSNGLTEEITKDLALLPALQVISRTSAMHYQGVHKPVPEIGRELGVDYVLEGTVRWTVGPNGRPRVRITPQLIRAADDTHVWADGFDKEVADIFAVQSEISRRVISKLGITLSAKEDRSLRTPPTDNLEAYQAYLRGLELRNQPFYSPDNVIKSVSMFERAVALDPGFASAWAELSQTHSYLAFNTDRSPARVEAARTALERANRLAPDLPAVQLAHVYFIYRCELNFDAAFEQLTALAKELPNDAEVLQTLGLVLRRKGQLEEANDALKRASALDPKTVKLVWAIGETYRGLRNYEEADRYYLQALSLAPDEPFFWEERARTKLASSGDLAAARSILAESPFPSDPKLMSISFTLDFYARDYRKALSQLSAERMRLIDLADQSLLSTWAAIALERLGDHQGALAAAEANRVTLQERMVLFPKEPLYQALLAIALAQLGRNAEALTNSDQAALHMRRDSFTGPYIIQQKAIVKSMVGQRHEAIGQLTWLLGRSYRTAISINELRLDPVWDPLRGDPEFEDLLRRFKS